MKPALVLISEPKPPINKAKYLGCCFQHVIQAGHFPISKDVYEKFMEMEDGKFLKEMMQICPAIYLFIDFGINSFMNKAIKAAVKNDIEVIYVRIDPKPDDCSWKLADVLQEVSNLEEIPLEVLKSETRRQDVADARFIAWRRIKEIFGDTVSYAKIGAETGGKDHATVMYGIKQAKQVRELTQKYEQYYGNK